MGSQLRSGNEKAAYLENLHKWDYIIFFSKDASCKMFENITRIGKIVMKRGVRPWLSNDWIYSLTALGRENRQCVEALHDFTNKVKVNNNNLEKA